LIQLQQASSNQGWCCIVPLWHEIKELRISSGKQYHPGYPYKQGIAEHGESLKMLCLDAGSNPASSTCKPLTSTRRVEVFHDTNDRKLACKVICIMKNPHRHQAM